MALISLKRTLNQTHICMLKLEADLPNLNKKLFELLENSNTITTTFHEQMQAFDPLLDSVQTIGLSIKETTKNLSKEHLIKKQWEETHKVHWAKQIGDILELGALGANVWEQIQKRRNYE